MAIRGISIKLTEAFELTTKLTKNIDFKVLCVCFCNFSGTVFTTQKRCFRCSEQTLQEKILCLCNWYKHGYLSALRCYLRKHNGFYVYKWLNWSGPSTFPSMWSLDEPTYLLPIFLQWLRFYFQVNDQIGQEVKLNIQPLQSNPDGRHSNLQRFLSERGVVMWMRKGYCDKKIKLQN